MHWDEKNGMMEVVGCMGDEIAKKKEIKMKTEQGRDLKNYMAKPSPMSDERIAN